MDKHTIGDMDVIFDHGGRRDWGKYTFPVYYGMPVIVRWRRHEFHFNLLGHVRRIYCRARFWPNAQETLKRTLGNDWVFLSTFGYEDSYSMLKTHYVPLTSYHDPAIFMTSERPLESDYVAQALETFDALVQRAGELSGNGAAQGRAGEFLKLVAAHDRETLEKETEVIHDILGGCMHVLPPDTIEVEYEVLPLLISDGCTGGCAFCKFNKDVGYSVRALDNIDTQVAALRDYFGPELCNYNALVLGQNDALAAGADVMEHAARLAYDELRIGESYHEGSNLFMFGGAHTFLETEEPVFRMLEELPYTNVYVNIGLESPHGPTLELLGKPQTTDDVAEAFGKMQRVNMKYKKVNISCNFVIGDELPPEHNEAVAELLASVETRMLKGTAFISPLEDGASPRRTRTDFTKIKLAARMPVYLYLVQRL